MKTRGKKRTPEVVFREGKPRAVIVDIEEYQEMLERVREDSLSFRGLDGFLKEYAPNV